MVSNPNRHSVKNYVCGLTQNRHVSKFRSVRIALTAMLISAAHLSMSHTVSQAAPGVAMKTSGSKTVTSKYGRTITVSPIKGIPRTGAWVTVKGKKFDERVGIYVTMCVKPKAGKQPTPCGGGINRTGTSAASSWISSNPPRYGTGLAKPYKIGGSFSTRIFIGPYIGRYDCRKVACVVVTRADHMQPSNRTADVFVPITFAK